MPTSVSNVAALLRECSVHDGLSAINNNTIAPCYSYSSNLSAWDPLLLGMARFVVSAASNNPASNQMLHSSRLFIVPLDATKLHEEFSFYRAAARANSKYNLYRLRLSWFSLPCSIKPLLLTSGQTSNRGKP